MSETKRQLTHDRIHHLAQHSTLGYALERVAERKGLLVLDQEGRLRVVYPK